MAVQLGGAFEIEHRQGTKNIVPDTLSRYSMENLCADVGAFIDLSSEAFKSNDYKELIETVQEKSDNLPDLRVMDKYVHKRTQHYDGIPINEDLSWKLWVPLELTQDIIIKAHCPPQVAHGGFHKTLRRI